jgi:hypothetical protein
VRIGEYCRKSVPRYLDEGRVPAQGYHYTTPASGRDEDKELMRRMVESSFSIFGMNGKRKSF